MKRDFFLFFCATILAFNVHAAVTPSDIKAAVDSAAKYKAGGSLEALRTLELAVPAASQDSQLSRPLVQGLIHLLQPAHAPEVRAFAAQQLARLSLGKQAGALAPLLTRSDSASYATLALSGSSGSDITSLLRQALPAAEPEARLQLVNTLGSRRDPKAVPPLTRLAAGKDALVANAAVAALGKIGTSDAASALLKISNQKNTETSPILHQAMLTCADQLALAGKSNAARKLASPLIDVSHPAALRRGAFLLLARTDSDKGQKRILATLREQDSVLRPVALAALAENPGNSAWIVENLATFPVPEQVFLVGALAQRNDLVSRQAVLDSLRSPEPEIRAVAVEALSMSDSVDSARALVSVLRDSKSPGETRLVENALIKLPFNEELDRTLASEYRHTTGPTRASMINVLSRRGRAEALDPIKNDLTSSDASVAIAAWRAFGRQASLAQAPELLRKMLALQNPSVQSAAASSLTEILSRPGNKAGLSAQINTLLKKTQNFALLLPLLPLCGDAEALEIIRASARQPSAREVAIESLAEWPDASAWNILLSELNGSDGALRASLMRGLARMAGELNANPNAELVQKYRDLLSATKNDTEVRVVLGALGGAAQPEALDLAESFLAKDAVRAEAAAAVRRIAEKIKSTHPEKAEAALKRISAQPKT